RMHLAASEPLSAAGWMLGLGTFVMWTVLGLTYVRALRPWLELLAGLGIVCPGTVSVIVSFRLLHDWSTAAAGVIIVAYFGLIMFRLRPLVAGVSAGLVIVDFLIAVGVGAHSLGVSALQAASAVTTSLTALVTGVL